MGDVGAPGVRDEWLCALWAVMALTPRHRYLVLTKRPERLAAWLGGGDAYDGVLRAADRIRRRNAKLTAIGISDPATVPLRNVVVGTSVSDQEQADARIQALLSVPAWLRWASHEPATGPVDFSPWIVKIDHCKGCGEEFQEKGHLKVCPKCGEDSLITTWGEGQAARLRSGERYEDTPQAVVDRDEGPQLHWIVTGAESGPHRRPFDRAWARTTMEQCAQAGIPWYYKQGAVGYCTDPDRSCPVDCERLTCSLPVVKHPRLDGHEHTAVPWEAR
jgi:protein gp37